MGIDDSLQLVDWTGRQIRSGQRGAMPQKTTHYHRTDLLACGTESSTEYVARR